MNRGEEKRGENVNGKEMKYKLCETKVRKVYLTCGERKSGCSR